MLVDTKGPQRYLPDLELVIQDKPACHSGESCTYLSFAGVFKPIIDKLPENLSAKDIKKILEGKLEFQDINGLVALAFEDRQIVGGFEIFSLSKNKILESFNQFPLDVTGCLRGGYILSRVHLLQDPLNPEPTYLVTDMNVGCCEKNARMNGTLYEFDLNDLN